MFLPPNMLTFVLLSVDNTLLPFSVVYTNPAGYSIQPVYCYRGVQKHVTVQGVKE